MTAARQNRRPFRLSRPSGAALAALFLSGITVGADRGALGLSSGSPSPGMIDSLPPDGTASVRSRIRSDVLMIRENGQDFFPREVFGVPGKPTPFPVTLPPARAGDYSLLTLRGFPEHVRLSAGIRFQESWAVSLNDIANLMLVPDAGFEGAFTIEASLLRRSDGALEKQSISVVIQRQRAGTTSQSIGSGQTSGAKSELPPSIGLSPSAQARIPVTEEASMMERANTLLQSGDVAAARLLYERLSKRGSAQGAFAMARTYDPEHLRSLNVIGLKSDIAKAKEWYKKAVELGSKDAVNRLATLELNH
jgi:hypothetical protein